MATITVLGAGMMGSALCVPLVDHGHSVRLVGTHLDGELIDAVRASGRHPKLGLELPRAIETYKVDDLQAAMQGTEVLGIGVSSAGVAWAGQKIAPYVRPDLPIVMITKGLEYKGGQFALLPDVLRSYLPSEVQGAISPAAVGGPCIAGELVARVPTCVVLTGRDARVLAELAELMHAPYYHVRTSTDIGGVQTCAALKNAYAMGVAFAWGQHEKRQGNRGSLAMRNQEAAVFAQTVVEMQRIVRMVGGDPATVGGLAGVGDLFVTCHGGRTGRFGRLLGLGLSVPAAIEKMQGATLECLEILQVMRAALPQLEQQGLLAAGELPLLRHLARVALDSAAVPVAVGHRDKHHRLNAGVHLSPSLRRESICHELAANKRVELTTFVK